MRHPARLRVAAGLLSITLFASACAPPPPAAPAAPAGAAKPGNFVIGVSNTLVGNGWREQMICAIKAQAKASGLVSKVIIVNRNGGPTEQIADLEGLISQGVNAIIVNPTDREGLNAVIEAAIAKGIVVVAVDQAVTAKGAYVVTNDQTAYARLGAEWLFTKLGGKGNVAEMRGIDGVPADTDRHNGFKEALAKYPDIKVVAETFTGWDPSKGAQQTLDLITTKQIDGIWTSGIDYPAVEQFQTANVKFVPIVGADNNGFIKQLIELGDKGLSRRSRHQPARHWRGRDGNCPQRSDRQKPRAHDIAHPQSLLPVTMWQG